MATKKHGFMVKGLGEHKPKHKGGKRKGHKGGAKKKSHKK